MQLVAVKPPLGSSFGFINFFLQTSFSYNPIVLYMDGKLMIRGFFWCEARIFWDYLLGYRILLTLWQ